MTFYNGLHQPYDARHSGQAYTPANEKGTSLRAAGWQAVAASRGGTRGRRARQRHTRRRDAGPKLRFEVRLANANGDA